MECGDSGTYPADFLLKTSLTGEGGVIRPFRLQGGQRKAADPRVGLCEEEGGRVEIRAPPAGGAGTGSDSALQAQLVF